jgi:exodeoxyribonuclease VII small subunit
LFLPKNSDIQRRMSEIANLTFEQAVKELEDIVRKLESGQIDLENAINFYELVNAIRKHCEEKLAAAKLKVEQIIKNPDGTISTKETNYA